MDNVKEQIKKAFQGSKKLLIKGYVSSKGEVSDYLVEMVGYEGYRSLVQQSHDYLSNLQKPDAFSDFDWVSATSEQLISYKNSLAGTTASRESNIVITPVLDSGYFLQENKPDAVILLHLKADKPRSPNKAAAHRDGLTAAKAWIRDNVPLALYINKMILEPGKFQAVTAL